MSLFSGKVLLGDLDDFIAPAQACSTGLFNDSFSNGKNPRTLVMEDDFEQSFGSSEANVIRTSTEKIATVSLEDCLACSGCITSAETILIQQQSISSFLDALKIKKFKVYVAIISRPSLISISHTLGQSMDITFDMVKQSLKNVGIDIVVRQDIGEQIAMIETLHEYQRRMASSAKKGELTSSSSYAVNSSLSIYPKLNQLPGTIDFSAITTDSEDYSLLSNADYFQSPEAFPSIEPNSPFITSNCPGWVCYAEKKAHALVPYLSTTCSAQQIMGTLLRKLLPVHMQDEIEAKDIFIASVVSCYDRKLEASRRDFLIEEGLHTINCVLSSQEMLELIHDSPTNVQVNKLTLQWDESWWLKLEQRCLTQYADSWMSSGGILKSIVGYWKYKESDAVVTLKPVRNNDYVEVFVTKDEQVLMKGCFIYGFRNIQNLVMKLKRKKCIYDVIEVMACPSGCLNGGGQIKPERREDVLHIANDLIMEYQKDGKAFDYPELEKNMEDIYLQLGCIPGSKEAYSLFHTRFHIIPEVTVNSLNW